MPVHRSGQPLASRGYASGSTDLDLLDDLDTPNWAQVSLGITFVSVQVVRYHVPVGLAFIAGHVVPLYVSVASVTITIVHIEITL